MDLLRILRELWRLKVWVLLALIPAVAIGLASGYRVSVSPPSLESRAFTTGAASAQFIVDRRRSAVVQFPEGGDPLVNRALQSRASTLARLIPSSQVLRLVTEELDLPEGVVVATPPAEMATSGGSRQSTAEQRATDIVAESAPYRIQIRENGSAPVITVLAQAPDAAQAKRLATATIGAIRTFVLREQRRDRVRLSRRVVLSQLGAVQGGTITTAPNRAIAVLTGIGTFLLLIVLILAVGPALRSLRNERRIRRLPPEESSESWPDQPREPDETPVGALSGRQHPN